MFCEIILFFFDSFIFVKDEPIVIKRKLNVNYKVFGKKKSEDSTMNAGSIVVSAVFRPVAAVEKSGKPIIFHHPLK